MDERMYAVAVGSAPDGTPGGVTAKSALKQTSFFIASVRARGGHLLKMVCPAEGGAGSSSLQNAMLRYLRRLKKEGRIQFFIPGESFGPQDEASRYVQDKFPFVSTDPDWNAGNRHIVVVCL
ncbi:MAG: hypothetical protein WDA00_01630 [Eubacteriales bacterium]